MDTRSNVDAQVSQPAPIMPPAQLEPETDFEKSGTLDEAGTEKSRTLYGAGTNEPGTLADPIEPTAEIPVVDEDQLRAREQLLNEREAELDRRAPREIAHLTDATVEGQILSEFAVCAYHAYADQPNITPEAERALKCTTLYVMVLRNGFPIVGTAVAAAPENFDITEGRKEARADAMAKLWLVEQYALQNRLMGIDEIPVADLNRPDPRYTN